VNDLHDLIHDAVADVEPADRLAELRTRTANPARAAARPWWWATGATVLATAAAVTVVAVVSDGPDAPGEHHHDMATEPSVSTPVIAVYFIGDSPEGDRLFREFDRVFTGDVLQEALNRTEGAANDPDYRSPWTAGSFGTVSLRDDGIHVELRRKRLAGDLAVQQVVYTLQAAVGEQLPVWFERVGRRGSTPVTAAPMEEVLNPVSVSDPSQGTTYTGSMIARGRILTDQSTVPWRIANDHMVVAEGTTAVSGEEAGFRPWQVEIDLSDLDPGVYTFTALAHSDAGYGADPPTDTRRITVR
jgi:hypothetical protein